MLEEEDEAQLPQPNISAFAGRALDPLVSYIRQSIPTPF